MNITNIPNDIFKNKLFPFLEAKDLVRTSKTSRAFHEIFKMVVEQALWMLINHPATLCGQKFALLKNFRPNRDESFLLIQKTLQKTLKIITQNAACLHIQKPSIPRPYAQAFLEINAFDQKCRDEKEKQTICLIQTLARKDHIPESVFNELQKSSLHHLHAVLRTISENSLRTLLQWTVRMNLPQCWNAILSSGRLLFTEQLLLSVLDEAAQAGQFDSIRAILASSSAIHISQDVQDAAWIEAIKKGDLDCLRIDELNDLVIKTAGHNDADCLHILIQSDRWSEVLLDIQRQAFVQAAAKGQTQNMQMLTTPFISYADRCQALNAAAEHGRVATTGFLLGSWFFWDWDLRKAMWAAHNHNQTSLSYLIYDQTVGGWLWDTKKCLDVGSLYYVLEGKQVIQSWVPKTSYYHFHHGRIR